MTVTGDPKRLERLLGYVSSDQFPADCSTVIGAAALKLVQDGFNNSSDPYGTRWAPLKSRRGKPLQKTGRLYRSAATRPLAGAVGVELGLTASYAVFHQDGTRGRASAKGTMHQSSGGIPARMMVPTVEHGLPEKWDKAFEVAVDSLMRRKERG
jgi:phage gpG-like protein